MSPNNTPKRRIKPWRERHAEAEKSGRILHVGKIEMRQRDRNHFAEVPFETATWRMVREECPLGTRWALYRNGETIEEIASCEGFLPAARAAKALAFIAERSL